MGDKGTPVLVADAAARVTALADGARAARAAAASSAARRVVCLADLARSWLLSSEREVRADLEARLAAAERAGTLPSLFTIMGRPHLERPFNDVLAWICDPHAEHGVGVAVLKRVWSDGTSVLFFSNSELVERLVALVPPPRANQVNYRGVVAANPAWRVEVVPSPPPESPEAAKARRAKRLTRHSRMGLAGERPSWSDLLERVFRTDGFAWPGCSGPLTLRCMVPPRARGASSTGSAVRPARLGSTHWATTGRRDDAGPGADPRARHGEGAVSGSGHQVGAPRREGQEGGLRCR